MGSLVSSTGVIVRERLRRSRARGAARRSATRGVRPTLRWCGAAEQDPHAVPYDMPAGGPTLITVLAMSSDVDPDRAVRRSDPLNGLGQVIDDVAAEGETE
jgi:hypothetical protein